MNPKSIKNLSAILWEVIDQIDEAAPGLPKGWKEKMLRKVINLEEILSKKK